jgi:hypothetical protein
MSLVYITKIKGMKVEIKVDNRTEVITVVKKLQDDM